MAARRLVIFDRDGTLVPLTPEPASELLPGALEALRLFKEAGARCVIATNQPGRDPRTVHALHDEIFEQAEGLIDAFYTCFHRFGCTCRKPAPGLLLEAMKKHGGGETWMIGDDLRDVFAADVAGINAALVLTGRTGPGSLAHRLMEERFSNLIIVDDVSEVAKRIPWS